MSHPVPPGEVFEPDEPIYLRSAPAVGPEAFWGIIRRHIWLMVGIVLVAGVLTLVALTMADPRYKARSTVVLSLFNSPSTSVESQAEPVELSRSIIETQIDVLRSRDFAQSVAESLGLYDDPRFVSPPAGDTELDIARHRQSVLDALLGSFSLSRSVDSMAIDIVVEAGDPELAAEIANGVARSYIDRTLAERTESLDRAITFLTERVGAIGEELTQAEIEMAAFIRDNGLDDERLDERLQADIDHLSRLLSVNLAGQQNSEEAQRVQAQLLEARNALQSRTGAELTRMRMEQGLDLMRSRYESTIEQLNELESERKFVAEGVRQISVAQVPLNSFWPNKSATMTISLTVAFVLAFVAAFLVDGLDKRIWNEDQIRRGFGVNAAGFVPRIKVPEGGMNAGHVIKYLNEQPRSAFSEALRGIVAPWVNNSEDPHLQMVTSGLPGEGKSLASVALASAASLDGMRVLLVGLDDPHTSTIAEPWADLPGYSVTDVLNKNSVPTPLLADGEPVPGLDVMRIDSRARATPKERLQAIEDLKTQMASRYDLVLIDTPPVLVNDDAIRFSKLANELLLVLRWGKSTEDELRDTMNRLSTQGLSVSAAVISDVDVNRHRRMGYGGQAKYFGNGKTSKA